MPYVPENEWEQVKAELQALQAGLADARAVAQSAVQRGNFHGVGHIDGTDPMWGEQTANTVWASNGSTGGPSFQALTSSFMPNLSKTILCGSAGLMPTTTNGATDTGKVELASGYDYYFLDFPDSAQKFACASLNMPDGYTGGTMTCRFIWYSTVGDNTKDVIWGCALLGVPDAGNPATGIGTAIEVQDTSSGTANRLQISAATAAITPGGTPAGGNYMYIRIYRDPTNGTDDFGATARLFGIHLEWPSTYGD